jgi:hypothetical protein
MPNDLNKMKNITRVSIKLEYEFCEEISLCKSNSFDASLNFISLLNRKIVVNKLKIQNN